MEVILKINDLKNPASFPAWLKIMAYHQCTRHYKKKETVHETATIENDDGWSVFDTAEETNISFIPDKALDQKEFKATILEMIEGLPDAQRAALHMFYYEELSLKVIAKIQGVSVNTANTRLNRGRLAMKDSIENYEKKHGVRLHSIAFFPFFKWLLKGSEEAMPAKSATKVAQQISSETGVPLSTASMTADADVTATTVTSASATIASGAGAAGVTAVATSIASKVIAGVVAVSVAVGGTTVYLQSQNRTHSLEDNKSVIIQTTLGNNITESVILDNKSIEDSNTVDLVYTKYEEILQTGQTPSGMTIRYYAYLDVDQNGIPDLIVADANGTPETWTTCELYTLGDDNVICCGTTDSNYDYLYHINNKYVRGNNRMGAQYISPSESICTTVYYWNDSGDRNDPAISYNGEGWEYISKEEFEYYNSLPGGFVDSFDIITLQENTLCDNNKLARILDISKSWGIRKDVSSSDSDFHMEQVFDFAFMEDGTFCCFFYQQYSDFLLGFNGTYILEDNHLTLSFIKEGEITNQYTYYFEPQVMTLTLISESGLWLDAKGTTYLLSNDEWYPTSQDVISAAEMAIALEGKEMGAG